MKQTIKEQLKKSPFFFNLLQSIYRIFFPPTLSLSEQMQKDILNSLKRKKTIFFVQVGSNDGVQGDPLHDLIVKNSKWSGIFIEPVGFLFDRLKQNYSNSDRFIFENKAIAPFVGELEFFYVSEEAKMGLGDALPFWYDQLGSFDKGHILKHLDGVLEPYIVSQKINAVPLQYIFDEHEVRSIDLIHIDAEGYDYKVLSTIDFSRYKPSVILYEHKHLSVSESQFAESLLNENGYICAHYGSDTLATIKR